jgi:hypothetical protein
MHFIFNDIRRYALVCFELESKDAPDRIGQVHLFGQRVRMLIRHWPLFLIASSVQQIQRLTGSNSANIFFDSLRVSSLTYSHTSL